MRIELNLDTKDIAQIVANYFNTIYKVNKEKEENIWCPKL